MTNSKKPTSRTNRRECRSTKKDEGDDSSSTPGDQADNQNNGDGTESNGTLGLYVEYKAYQTPKFISLPANNRIRKFEDEGRECIKDCITFEENQTNNKVKMLRTDIGT
ncbi:unnamed protein product [Orchesella dallaii]|uniref:Uncharacterized protein n=1 Tax=Orchesella dallaii TaxID=48710 RepID=A0ABP1RH89_9HEXA